MSDTPNNGSPNDVEPTRDQLDAMRFLDGEMHDVERTRFAQRLEQEPGLQDQVALLREDRQWFAPERQHSQPVPDGMVAAVLARLGEQPEADDADQAGPAAGEAVPGGDLPGGGIDPLAGTLRWSQGLLLAALVLFGLAVAMFMGSFASPEAERLEASPDRIRMEMEKLDQQIRAEAAQQAGAPEQPGGGRDR